MHHPESSDAIPHLTRVSQLPYRCAVIRSFVPQPCVIQRRQGRLALVLVRVGTGMVVVTFPQVEKL